MERITAYSVLSAAITEEQVRHLDTKHFNRLITAYGNYIRQYENVVSESSRILEIVLENWKGEGKKAFEKDSRQVQLNLKDIADIMYDLRDALINAHAEYMKADNELSKSFES